MSTITVERIEKQINELTAKDRAELLRRINTPKARSGGSQETAVAGRNGYVSPNTIWIRDNSHLYRGQYVAIKDGKFIAAGRTIRDADLAARSLGISDPLLHYVLAEGEVAYCGIIE